MVAASVWVAGCGGPVVTVRHVLPAAVPLPAEAAMVRVRKFTVEPADQAALAAPMTEALQKRLSRHWAIDGDAETRATAVEVGGILHADVRDAKSSRRLRQWDAATREWREVEVPTLVRTVALVVEFAVFRPGADERLLTVEIRRSYDSTEDPRVRGDLGLERPDDPDRVPPADEIARALLEECADAFIEMISTHEVAAEVPTRGTWNRNGSDGLKAAGQGDFEAAILLLEAAVAANPKDTGLLFDLAVACEGGGRLQDALDHYRAVVERTGGKDPAAVEAAARVERVLTRMGGR